MEIRLEEQNKCLKALIKFNLKQRIKIFEEARKEFYKIRQQQQEDISSAALSYYTLIYVINKEISNMSELDKNLLKYRSNLSKKKLKQDLILEKLAILKELKYKEKLSYREIAKYFKKYNKIEVSASLVFKICKKYCKGEQNAR